MAAQVLRNVGRLATNNCYFFLCDMQEKFQPIIRYFPEITTVAKKMVEAANILEIPVIATEQYPKGLGNTVKDIDISKAQVFEKTKFSMVIPEVEEILRAESSRKSVVLFGIETQVCVQQTCLDLIERGFDVHVVADGCSSRSQVDRFFAFERMRQCGAFVSTSESVLFELLGDSKHPKFKQVQPLVKTSAPDSGLLTKL
ncbi:PREDICTED: isochorismatase domain-containing protein 2-like [Amphimedon queenslandica]|uniref:Isochorismatase-like domain-containing protein n=1 Tax=Amphimedon queenslandica TaxID=400682 RepID=A0A1X7VVD9_AMPQE|nr:PREDICTED: isochorismatase domain-containing protein 2-like [Amphimedon queenslandica]|eukprot:XP_003382772.1 PREDICTED: isochorismatase domain-containing protein 2-like [Amphimedon queenslandica]